MSRKKIKADSVEQLMEIVRAIQNGEEPDDALRRKMLEGAPEADSPNPYSEEEENGTDFGENRKKKQARRSERDAEKGLKDKAQKEELPEGDSPEDDYPDDEFDKILNEDEELDLRPALERISKGAGRIAGVLKGLGAKFKDGAGSGKKRGAGPETGLDAESAEPGEDEKVPGDSEEDDMTRADSAEHKTARADSGKSGAAPGDEEFDTEFDEESDTESGEPVFDKLMAASGKDAPELSRAGKKPEGEMTAPDGAMADEPEEGRKTGEKPAGDEEPGGPGDGKARETRHEIGKLSTGKLSAGKSAGPGPKLSGLAGSAKDSLFKLRETLEGKGIRRREMIMLGMGALLILLIIALIAGGISSSREEKAKSKNVTADDGLSVTVEQQPEQWSSSYPVVLRFRAQGRTITKVTVNGEDYVPDENNHIVVNATDYLLEAVADTDQGTLNARIEIPMIDSQPPVVNVSREKEQITVTAADSRSTVAKIYYAAVHDGDYIQLPEYQLYSEPLAFEADTTYYFYAVDKAGNRSNPVVTTTETASEMTLDKEELALFPEETGYLTVAAAPANALLNNLRYESGDEDVVTVTAAGTVTAVGQGSTVITVSADGVEDISCPVVVSPERTVTISAIGDCTLGTDETFNTDTNFDAFDSVYGHEYFFRNVKEILENDDVTFANLEGPLTDNATKTTAEQYAFKGDPAYTEVLENGSVEVVTLANNHINDYGSQGLEDTKSALTEAGIDYCIDDEIALRDVNGIRTAFIGIYELNEGIQCESRVRETIAQAKAQGAQLVIVAFHWGSEKSNEPDEVQQSLAHTAVDCGADLVVGHHPHVLQGIEKYNGKYIVYSLANFCFGGNSAPTDMDTIIFRQTFSVTRDSVKTDDRIEIIPCSVSSAEGYNNYQPTPAADTEAERIVQRLNEYSSSFGQSFTASDGLGEPAAQAQSSDESAAQAQSSDEPAAQIQGSDEPEV